MQTLTPQQCSTTKADTNYRLDPNGYDTSKIRNLIMAGDIVDIASCLERVTAPKVLSAFWNASVCFGHLEAIKILWEKPEFNLDVHSLSQTITQNELGILEYVLSQGYDIDSEDGYLLFCAFLTPKLEFSKYLIDNNADFYLLKPKLDSCGFDFSSNKDYSFLEQCYKTKQFNDRLESSLIERGDNIKKKKI